MSQKEERPGAKSPRFKPDTLKRLIGYIFRHYKWIYLLILVGIIITSLASVSASLFMEALIDQYIQPLIISTNKDFGPLFRALSFMAVIYLTGVLANLMYQKLLVIVSQGTMEKIRNDLFTHMQTLPLQYFDTNAHGDIMSIYTNDTDTLRQVISQSIPNFLTSLFTIITVFIAMISVSIPLTILTLLMMGVIRFFNKIITERSGKYFIEQQQMLGIENSYIEEMMKGIKVVNVFNYEERAINNFNDINEQLFKSSYNANKYANILMPIVGNIGHISYVLVAIVGGFLAINNLSGLTIGGLASFLALNRSFNGPINQISQQINAVIMAMAGAERIFNLLNEESEVDDGEVSLVNVEITEDSNLREVDEPTETWAWKYPQTKESYEYIQLKGDIRFDNLTFSYVPNNPVLYDIDLYAKSGEKIAFVGATGAGKTTIINLINRFYDIEKGTITYDGIDTKLIKKADLRRSMGIVLQDTNLFIETIEENIKYARPEADREQVIEAAKLANAHTFIKQLEFGYDTILTNGGSSLSQGQRQLLSIARAALANSPVLILDEATSSIDSQTEKLIQEGLDKLMDGRTTFVIAHRLSTIKNSDIIIVLDQGKIIESGTHETLMENRGTYYQLYTGLV